MNVILRHLGEKSILQFCNRFSGPCTQSRVGSEKNTFASRNGQECTSFSTYSNALRFLQNFAFQRDAITELRALISQNVLLVWRFEDQEIISKCAYLLAEGRLCVVHATNSESKSSSSESKKIDQGFSDTEALEKSNFFKPQTNELISNPTPPIDFSLLAQINQSAQAEALVYAARNGIAFCEECKKSLHQ